MGEKILIVDDDLESIKLIGLMLQRRGYEITAAHAGSQALIKAETEKPDLIILDVMMPDMDGYQVCRQLRSNPYTAHLPVLMFTAKTLVGDKVAGFQAGADDYLTKPIHPVELVSRVESLLQRADKIRDQTTSPDRARIVGLIGAKGGVGTSTLVVNLALAAQQLGDDTHKGDEPAEPATVTIADLRVSSGSIALQLGQTPPPQSGLSTLIGHNPDDMDEETINKQIVTHSSGLRYLPAPLQPESGQGYLSPSQANFILNHMATTADYLFLDLGSMLDETTSQVVARCDVVLVVIEPEHLCLTFAKALLNKLKSLDPAPNNLNVVIVERTTPHHTQEEIKELLEHEIISIIGSASGAIREASEQEQPIILSQPESETAAQLRELAQKLL